MLLIQFGDQYHFPNKDVVAELELHAIPLESTPERGMMELVWREPGGGFSLRGARR